MIFSVLKSSRFKKSLARIVMSGTKDMPRIELCIALLKRGASPPYYKVHVLKGDYVGLFECHIKSDLLLIYSVNEDLQVITLNDIGSHSELFG